MWTSSPATPAVDRERGAKAAGGASATRGAGGFGDSDSLGGGYADDYGASGLIDVASQVYRRYQERLLEQNALDFDDLLMRTVDILRLFPERLRLLPRSLQIRAGG